MKKIIIEKEEGIAEVIDRVVGEPDDEIALVVPNGSALGRSVRNFHMLKREADAAGKSVAIESVDETILAFAKQSDVEATHPLWRGVRGGGGVADIIPAGRGEDRTEENIGGGDEPSEEDAEENSTRRKPAAKRGKKRVPPVKLTVHEETGEEEAEGTEEPEVTVTEYDYREEGRTGWRLPRKPVWIAAGVLIVVLVALAITTWSFGHVAITINFKKTPWTYQDNFAADKSVSRPSSATNLIPAQVFSTQKNTTQTFPASGSAKVSLKAQGTMTIYNAYSSAAQQLVATTRFVTPDGKLFRLVGTLNVPGAAVTNGKIVPSSIDAEVVADQAGPAYNVGSVAKLVIPGFQGSPKYDAFYGELKNGTTGGFVGTKAVPTAADVTSAKAKVSAALQANLTSDLTTSYPNNFKILDGATSVTVTKLTVSTTTDANGNFSVFGEATLQAIGFDEAAFKTFLLSIAQGQKSNSTFSSLALTYTNIKADFTRGHVSFSLAAQGTLEPAFSPADFGAGIAGKKIGDARTAIAALPDLADGKISAWPMWLWNIPLDPNKIEVNAH
jgi:hypothetical protein